MIWESREYKIVAQRVCQFYLKKATDGVVSMFNKASHVTRYGDRRE